MTEHIRSCGRALSIGKLCALSGTLFLPGPGLEKEAWRRRLGRERDYSLCGVTHTVASSRVANALGEYLTTPTQPWDALICTSKAVRSAVERMLEHRADYLERRGGGRFVCPMRLPVIPLGIDCEAFGPRSVGDGGPAGPESRPGVRTRYGIAEGDSAVLFVGRLAFHSKAQPTPMYIAAARAAQRVRDRTIHLLLAGQFPNPGIEMEFRNAANRFAGAARVHFLDASDSAHGPLMRAADAFVSLSDNIQETFGLTPVEAMAAGLPCVVSDWNGYKDTVVDGETGFRIPTTSAGPGAGPDNYDRDDRHCQSRDRGRRGSLRRCLHQARPGSRLARAAGDGGDGAGHGGTTIGSWWSRRTGSCAPSSGRSGPGASGVALRGHAREPARSDFPDPFTVYRGYPTGLLGPDSVVTVKSRNPAGDLARLREGKLHTFAAHAFLTDPAVSNLIACLADGPARAGDLATELSASWRKVSRTLLWLRKFDLVEFEADSLER